MTSYIIAEYDSPSSLMKAAEACRDAKLKDFDAHSPFPIHGMDDAMGMKPSPLGWYVLIGGFIGLSVGLGLQTWVATIAYKLVISGKPFFSYQAFIPVTFELMVLFSAFTAVFGMFKLNKLPMFYHPLLKSENFLKVTSHGFFISILNKNQDLDESKLKELLTNVGGTSIEVVKG